MALGRFLLLLLLRWTLFFIFRAAQSLHSCQTRLSERWGLAAEAGDFQGWWVVTRTPAEENRKNKIIMKELEVKGKKPLKNYDVSGFSQFLLTWLRSSLFRMSLDKMDWCLPTRTPLWGPFQPPPSMTWRPAAKLTSSTTCTYLPLFWSRKRRNLLRKSNLEI